MLGGSTDVRGWVRVCVCVCERAQRLTYWVSAGQSQRERGGWKGPWGVEVGVLGVRQRGFQLICHSAVEPSDNAALKSRRKMILSFAAERHAMNGARPRAPDLQPFCRAPAISRPLENCPSSAFASFVNKPPILYFCLYNRIRRASRRGRPSCFFCSSAY